MLISLLVGELAQVATLRKLECMILQPSHERVVAVCNILDNLHSDDCKFRDYTAAVQVLVELKPLSASGNSREGVGMRGSTVHFFYVSAVTMKVLILYTF